MYKRQVTALPVGQSLYAYWADNRVLTELLQSDAALDEDVYKRQVLAQQAQQGVCLAVIGGQICRKEIGGDVYKRQLYQ